MDKYKKVSEYIEIIMTKDKNGFDGNRTKGYRIYHSRLVANLCLYILDNSAEIKGDQMNINRESIMIAALLHDIKKNEKQHAKRAADDLDEIIKDIGLYSKNTDDFFIYKKNIEEMIRYHSSNNVNSNIEIKIIQDADKISKYYTYLDKRILEYKFKLDKFDKKSHEKVKNKHKKLNYEISKDIIERIEKKLITVQI